MKKEKKMAEYTVINDILERVNEITPEQFEWCERSDSARPPEPTDKIIGVIESRATRALWVLSCWLKSRADLEHSLALASVDPIAAEEHKGQHAILDELGDVARAIFWAQAKTDLAYYKYKSVGLRAGYTLVEYKDDVESPFLRLFRRGED